MSEKKHIDRLFQEKFKDFEAKPSASVWAGIENRLEQPNEKNKKVFPLWLRFSGIAATLLLLLTAGNFMLNNKIKTTTENPVVEITKESKTINNTTTTHNNEAINLKKEVKITQTSFNTEASIAKNKTLNNETIVTNTSNSVLKNNIVNTASNNKKSNLQVKQNVVTAKSNKKIINKNANRLISKNNRAYNTKITTTKDYISQVQNTKKTQQYSSNTSENKISNTVTSTTNLSPISTSTNKNIINNEVENTLNNTSTAIKAVAITNNNTEKEEEKMMEPERANSSKTIEEALAKIKNIDEKEKNVNRWIVSTNIAPVYYNTLGKGSHIDEQFVNNTKNGEINTSYGVKVSYVLNKKLKVRSGINKLNLSYDTADVVVFENTTNASNSDAYRNIKFVDNNDIQNLSVLNSNNLFVQQINDIFGENLNAALSQRLSYFEVPLEMEYALVEKRFSLNLIGGLSTFILNNNEIVTELENRKTKIGEANNINNVSFSANAGIGIDYKFSKSMKFNLEPTFKYQINAYNDTSGDFRPYIIGVYTGLSYKF